MDFSLTNDQRNLRDRIYRFAQAELNEAVRDRDKAQVLPHDLWVKCGDEALHGLPVPRQYGGAGLDAVSTAVALEAFGHGCEDGGLVFAVCAHMLACVVPIWLHGSEAQKRALLPSLSNGRMIAVNAMTEPGSGSDLSAIKTHAVADGDDFIIDGTKTFASNGPVADVALVYAATDQGKGFLGGTTAFLVNKDAPGFSRGHPFETMGLRTCPIGQLAFDGVRVGREAALGAIGSGGPIFVQSMEWERVCIAAAHVGEMERLLARATEFAKTRKASGRPIGKLQAVSHRIADMKVRLEAARLLTYHAAAQLDTGRSATLAASIAKVFVSEALVRSALDTIQVLGGHGFMTEYDVERGLRDAVGGMIYSGTSDVQRNIIAQWLGL